MVKAAMTGQLVQPQRLHGGLQLLLVGAVWGVPHALKTSPPCLVRYCGPCNKRSLRSVMICTGPMLPCSLL